MDRTATRACVPLGLTIQLRARVCPLGWADSHAARHTLSLSRLRRLDEMQSGTGLVISASDLREALTSLERDGLVKFTRQNVITVL